MDLDRFLAINQPAWDRLAGLTGRARGGLSSLSAAELDELVQLYQRVSGHLSYARTYYGDPALVARLTGIVATAGGLIYGSRPRTLRAMGRFFTVTFPAAVWHNRWFVAISALLFFAPAIALGTWLAQSPAAVEASAPAQVREAYLARDFEDYYSSQPAAEFASLVTTNNIQVSFLAFASGILLCVPTAYVLVMNGASLGMAGGLFAAAGASPKFFGLILPHGLLEITAVVIAGGAGLRLGWTIIDPGDRRRGVALREEGRRAAAVVLGLMLAFVVAGIIEGFVTGSGLPTALRVGVGATVEAAFLLYLWSFGSRAAAAGYTGAIGEGDGPGWAGSQSRPVALTLR
ncbi:MAG: stage II sporulation protein M [Acidimicrobiales bacterium]